MAIRKSYRGIRVKPAKAIAITNKVNRIKQRGVKPMDKIVSTNMLFSSTKNYSQLSYDERRQYVNDLSKEFIVSARELLESLKDK